MFKAKVIVVSDRCFTGENEDLTGPALNELLINSGYLVDSVIIVPDEKNDIINALTIAVDEGISLILTAGGTGFSKRDITPECTKEVITREVPGISEYMRMQSMKKTPHAILSRGVSGIVDNSLIINLPGSPKAATENLSYIIGSIKHGLNILSATISDCKEDM